MRVYDVDNQVGFRCSRKQAEILKAAMERGEIRDCCFDALIWEDCLDCHGDLDLDENAYEDARAALAQAHGREVE
jgi:hypothetical protein